MKKSPSTNRVNRLFHLVWNVVETLHLRKLELGERTKFQDYAATVHVPK